jgi:hypothetical protein
MTNNKKQGVYVEIGAHDAVEGSNTLILESEFAWSGISLEINKEKADKFNLTRINKCINANALKFNYKSYFRKTNFPLVFDYLSLDIEPARNTFRMLLKFPIRKYKPLIITFEHDKYVNRINWIFQILTFIYLFFNGYVRIKKDVTPLQKGYENDYFEDWYVFKSLLR